MKIEEINLEYYDELYGNKGAFLTMLHPLISFDQQSKSKRNFKILRDRVFAGKKAQAAPLRVLDYGFGHGSLLLKMPRAFEIYGTDLSRAAIKSLLSVAKLKGRRMKLFQADEFEEKVRDIEFDIITCSHVLEHVPDDAAMLRFFRSKLAPGGRILINLPFNEVWQDPKHLRKYTTASIQSLFRECGIEIESTWVCDRWSAFFLVLEQAHPARRFLKFPLRFLRAFFAVIPLKLVDALETLLPAGFQEQQILVLAGKR